MEKKCSPAFYTRGASVTCSERYLIGEASFEDGARTRGLQKHWNTMELVLFLVTFLATLQNRSFSRYRAQPPRINGDRKNRIRQLRLKSLNRAARWRKCCEGKTRWVLLSPKWNLTSCCYWKHALKNEIGWWRKTTLSNALYTWKLYCFTIFFTTIIYLYERDHINTCSVRTDLGAKCWASTLRNAISVNHFL